MQADFIIGLVKYSNFVLLPNQLCVDSSFSFHPALPVSFINASW